MNSGPVPIDSVRAPLFLSSAVVWWPAGENLHFGLRKKKTRKRHLRVLGITRITVFGYYDSSLSCPLFRGWALSYTSLSFFVVRCV
jgi:hypothetical protein